MSTFSNVKNCFDANWTTILVGWMGLGSLSPWPDRWAEFPSLISPRELKAYAQDRLKDSEDVHEMDLVLQLISSLEKGGNREAIRFILQSLSTFDGGNLGIELRKWRLLLLEECLKELPNNPLHGLLGLSEFWQNFGFPPDSPHTVQGRGNEIDPSSYYTEENFRHSLSQHDAWLKNEKDGISRETFDLASNG